MSVCSRNLAKCSSFLAGLGIRGHVCWAKLSTCVLDPKASLFLIPFPPWQPIAPSLLAPSHQLQLKCSRESPNMELRDWESDPALSPTKCLTLGRVGHVAEPQFPYLEIGVLKVKNSTFSPIWFPTAPHLVTSAPSRPVSCRGLFNKFTR